MSSADQLDIDLETHLDEASPQLYTDAIIVRRPQSYLPPTVFSFGTPCRFLCRYVTPVVLQVSKTS